LPDIKNKTKNVLEFSERNAVGFTYFSSCDKMYLNSVKENLLGLPSLVRVKKCI